MKLFDTPPSTLLKAAAVLHLIALCFVAYSLVEFCRSGSSLKQFRDWNTLRKAHATSSLLSILALSVYVIQLLGCNPMLEGGAELPFPPVCAAFRVAVGGLSIAIINLLLQGVVFQYQRLHSIQSQSREYLIWKMVKYINFVLFTAYMAIRIAGEFVSSNALTIARYVVIGLSMILCLVGVLYCLVRIANKIWKTSSQITQVLNSEKRVAAYKLRRNMYIYLAALMLIGVLLASLPFTNIRVFGPLLTICFSETALRFSWFAYSSIQALEAKTNLPRSVKDPVSLSGSGGQKRLLGAPSERAPLSNNA